MNEMLKKILLAMYFMLFTLPFSSSVSAGEDQNLADMQRRLNEQVLSTPHNVTDDATLTNSLSEATERGKPTKSEVQTPYYNYFHDGYYYPYSAYSRGYWY
ncbi:MAG: hypothetical protein WC782_15585 [Methylococcaceae bacterium]|jgi:hypothetical protein